MKGCVFFPVMQEELSSLFETLSAGVGDDMRSEARGKSSNTPLLVMDPRRLIELLQICTLIAQGQQHSCFYLWIFKYQIKFGVTRPEYCMELNHGVKSQFDCFSLATKYMFHHGKINSPFLHGCY